MGLGFLGAHGQEYLDIWDGVLIYLEFALLKELGYTEVEF